MLHMLTENGPCRVTPVLTTVPNPHSWTGAASMLWVDQPVGVGFSYATEHAGWRLRPRMQPGKGPDAAAVGVPWDGAARTALDTTIADTLRFLQRWLKHHPSYRKRDLFVMGAGFGGHFAPALGAAILDSNKQFANAPIQLRGVAVGNGDADQVALFRSYPHYVKWAQDHYKVSLLDEAALSDVATFGPECFKLLAKCDQYARALAGADGGAGEAPPSGVLGPASAARLADRDCKRAAQTCQSVFFSPCLLYTSPSPRD